MAALARTRPGRSRGAGWAYAVLAIVAWLCTLHSGVHATVAGVAAALFVPLRLDAGGDSLLLRMEHALAPWVGYLILPLFGLANAGAQLAGGWSDLLAPLPLGIAAGLFLGKQAGILGAIWLAVRLRFAVRPAGAGWLHLWGMALLCGIGFTMSLFISALAFPAAPALVEEAKLGVLAGSMLSAILGYGVLRAASSRS
jgi:NhaA family Na+:H+ antiporter